MTRSLTLLAATVLCVTGSETLHAFQQAPADEPQLETRFYDVSQLLVAKPQYPFTGRLPASSARTTSTPIYDGGLGGGGMGGMGGGGGSGLFSVAPAAIQFGGGGYGGGGFDVGIGNPAAEAENFFLVEHTADGIADLIMVNIAPDSWQDLGGSGSITALGNTLLVRHTPTAHADVSDFLRQLTAAVVGVDVYNVEVWWIPANSAERRNLDALLDDAGADGQSNNAITALCETAGGYHGRLLCRERTTAHLASGIRRPLVVGSIPVVGGETSLAQPIVNHINIGLTFEATVIPVAGYLSPNADDQGGGRQFYLNLRTAITSQDAADVQVVSGSDIDRFHVGANVLESGCRVDLGVPTLIGTLTSVGIAPKEGDDDNETAVVIRITRR